jgi:hypothetical protein
MRRFGGLIGSLSAVLLAGCFYSFAGGGLPPHIHTMAIGTFENQTASPDVPVGFSANPQQAVSARRRLQITIEVEIVDQSNGRALYSNKSLRQEADYNERAEQDGRRQAIDKIVQQIIDGVQSNW